MLLKARDRLVELRVEQPKGDVTHRRGLLPDDPASLTPAQPDLDGRSRSPAQRIAARGATRYTKGASGISSSLDNADQPTGIVADPYADFGKPQANRGG